jgi:hypothetical protein
MDFKTYYLSLSQQERSEFAEKVGTTMGYCHQIAYGDKQIELGLADVIVAISSGALTLHDLPLTDRAEFQSKARIQDVPAAIKEAA